MNRGPTKQVRALLHPLVPSVLLLSGHTLLDRFSPPHLDFHFHARPEPLQDGHQAIDGETPEISIADTREVGCRNGGAAMSKVARTCS